MSDSGHMSQVAQTVWLIGASSGIGAAAARLYAQQGAKVILSARSADRLAEVVAGLPGVGHRVLVLDVAEPEAVEKAAKTVFAENPKIDRVIFLAAVYEPLSFDNITPEILQQTLQINVMGAFYVSRAVVPLLRAQKGGGQLALCGSVAGYRGLPRAQPYAASKAALISLAESLRAETAGQGVDVRLINPGFVDTPLTQKNSFTMPMMVSAEKAASSMIRQLQRTGFEVVFPRLFVFLMKLMRVLPYRVYFFMTRRMR